MQKKPEIIVFAGPNGSGKSTITRMANIIEPYINADDIKKITLCSDLEAAQIAEKMRNKLIDENTNFTFETVLSTERNLILLKKAKDAGYFIKCFYVITADVNINIIRVKSRVISGGHDVPADKIISRYHKALKIVPQLIDICDIFHLYDNSDKPFRIFKKRKVSYFYWENSFWKKGDIERLVNVGT